MRFHPTTADNSNQLHHLAALLCALADLAERAAGRSAAVCWLVIWIIGPAEAVARDYVDKIAPGATPVPAPLRPLDGEAEALQLAWILRCLAATLAALAEQCLALIPAAFANPRIAREVAPLPVLVIPCPGRQPCPP